MKHYMIGIVANPKDKLVFMNHVETWKASAELCGCGKQECKAHVREMSILEICVAPEVSKKFEEQVLRYWVANGGSMRWLIHNRFYKWFLKLVNKKYEPCVIENGRPPFNFRSFTIFQKDGDAKVWDKCPKCNVLYKSQLL